MSTAIEQARGAGHRDVSRFLAAHEACASDFSIGRLEGAHSSALGLICTGCGEGAAYDPSRPGMLRALDSPPPAQRASRRMTREELERWLPAPAALPWWIPNVYIVVVIAVGVALIAFGVLGPRSDDPALLGGGDSEPTTEVPTGQASQGPAPPPEPAPIREPETKPEPELDGVTVLDRFRIGVPEGWLKGMGGGAVVLASPGEAQLRVFLEPGEERLARLARQARGFLASQYPAAEVSDTRRLRLGGVPAVALVARWKGASVRAVVLSEGGNEYLLLSRVEDEARRSARVEARAALKSFDVL